MKKTLLFGILATVALGASAAEEEFVMDLRNGEFSYNENGSWVDTYNEDAYTVDVDIFSASHTSSYYGTAYDGFLPCISSDNTDHTTDGWYTNQWGCMAGGAVKVGADGKVVTDENGKVVAEAGAPYLMAYWSAYTETATNHVNMIVLSSENTLYAKEVYVSTHPYAYYTLINGDYYSRKFDKADDEFVLHIHGLDKDFADNGKVVSYVLTNTVENGEGAYVPNQSTDWNLVDLSSLGQIYGVYFTMESTDMGDYGINTPTYFCLDRFTVSTKDNSAVKAINVESNGAADYYTLQGVKMSASQLTPGIYVKVVDGKATKVRIR